jgi:hypothetical protein
MGRHHCWAAGPLGLGFPVSLYIVTPSIINTTVHLPTDETTNKMAIASGILNKNTICGTETKVKIHRSVHITVIRPARSRMS